MNSPLVRRPATQVENESAALVARLVACIPAATYEMETLCRLAGIRSSRNIPTAAVECVQRPQLLLNPDFVARYCERDEHLFLLVMHELWHVILAHTTLYPRGTRAHNIAFDAIINAGLARQFNRPEYRGFFEAINRDDAFPNCLLRPPEGWPTNPVYRDDIGPDGTREIIERLYPPNNFHRWSAPLYQEILDLLSRWEREESEKRREGEGEGGEPTLLGDHRENGQDGQALDDPLMSDVIRRVASSWPPPPFAKAGKRGEGFQMHEVITSGGASTEEARRLFSRVLQRAVGPRRGREQRKRRTPISSTVGMNVMPNPRDRMASARQELGVQGVLWGQAGLIQARMIDETSRTHVYLDVSGSMSDFLPSLISLLIPYVARKQAFVYQFSTQVVPMSLGELRQGKIRTTVGTSINAVIAHALNTTPPVRRILILTDGYVGTLHQKHVNLLAERKMRIIAVLPSVSASVKDLKPIAQSIVILPMGRRR